jgi:hypothetical protein
LFGYDYGPSKEIGMRYTTFFLGLICVIASCGTASAQGSARTNLYFCCSPENDLYRLYAADGENWVRYDDPGTAVANAPKGAGLLVLADTYPAPLNISTQIREEAIRKSMRLYIEYPANIMGIYIKGYTEARNERVAVYSDWLGAPQKGSLMTAHGCHYQIMNYPSPYLVLGRLAGYDKIAFDFPAWVAPFQDEAKLFPILMRHPLTDSLIASTKLSNFVTGRYAPEEEWRIVWQKILQWASGKPLEMRHWVLAAGPSYGPTDPLPQDAQEQAWRKAIQWYQDSRMLIHPDWLKKVQEAKTSKDQIAPAMDEDYAIGDGKLGVLEGFSSEIDYNGLQPARYWIRADCVSETAAAFALASTAAKSEQYAQVAANLQNFLYGDSGLTGGPRADAKSPSYGLIGWNTDSGVGSYFGDDNARAMLGTMTASAAMKSDAWLEPLMRALLANLRTSGKSGFRGNMLNETDLQQKGWRAYFDADTINVAPHYESYLWACYLWAYQHSGYAPFLEKAKTAIQKTMQAYPDNWLWTNGMQQERARMLLPLSWLVRIEGTDEHRQWLRKIAEDMLKLQDASGAIREELGAPDKGSCAPPKSHDEYGTRETSIIQNNGDPASDFLYTIGFAFLGLHEAAAATNDSFYTDAENKLADFVCRAQVKSRTLRQFNGGWFRAFDFSKWEYWGSSGDAGWGAWCMETGWGHGWITSSLLLRQMKSSLWDLTAGIDMKPGLAKLEPVMMAEAGGK